MRQATLSRGDLKTVCWLDDSKNRKLKVGMMVTLKEDDSEWTIDKISDRDVPKDEINTERHSCHSLRKVNEIH